MLLGAPLFDSSVVPVNVVDTPPWCSYTFVNLCTRETNETVILTAPDSSTTTAKQYFVTKVRKRYDVGLFVVFSLRHIGHGFRTLTLVHGPICDKNYNFDQIDYG